MRTVVLCVLTVLLSGPAAGAAGVGSPAETKRIVHAWSDRLNSYDNAGVARLFATPAVFVQGGSVLRLETGADIALWHRLPTVRGPDRLDHGEGRVRHGGLRARRREAPAL